MFLLVIYVNSISLIMGNLNIVIAVKGSRADTVQINGVGSAVTWETKTNAVATSVTSQ